MLALGPDAGAAADADTAAGSAWAVAVTEAAAGKAAGAGLVAADTHSAAASQGSADAGSARCGCSHYFHTLVANPADLLHTVHGEHAVDAWLCHADLLQGNAAGLLSKNQVIHPWKIEDFNQKN